MAETFSWCPAPGASLTRRPRLFEAAYGDGYTHRATTGINIMQDAWSLSFAGDEATLGAIDLFLYQNAVPGFWFALVEGGPVAFFVCDEWNLSFTDKSRARGMLGSITAVFRRVYNIQPGPT